MRRRRTFHWSAPNLRWPALAGRSFRRNHRRAPAAIDPSSLGDQAWGPHPIADQQRQLGRHAVRLGGPCLPQLRDAQRYPTDWPCGNPTRQPRGRARRSLPRRPSSFASARRRRSASAASVRDELCNERDRDVARLVTIVCAVDRPGLPRAALGDAGELESDKRAARLPCTPSESPAAKPHSSSSMIGDVWSSRQALIASRPTVTGRP